MTDTGYEVEEALAFIEQIKNTYGDNNEIYDEFLRLVRQGKAGVLSAKEFMRESRALFASHPALTETLNKFFDNGCGDDKVDTHTPFHQAHAMQYVVKVRNRFHDCPEVYGSFLTVLTTMSHPHNHAAILREVATLFYGHADLMMEFTHFLPLTEQTAAQEFMRGAIRSEQRQRGSTLDAVTTTATNLITPPSSPPAPTPAAVEGGAGSSGATAGTHSSVLGKRGAGKKAAAAHTVSMQGDVANNCGTVPMERAPDELVLTLPVGTSRRKNQRKNPGNLTKAGKVGMEPNSEQTTIPFPGSPAAAAAAVVAVTPVVEPTPTTPTNVNTAMSAVRRNKHAAAHNSTALNQRPEIAETVEQLHYHETNVVSSQLQQRLSALECRVEWQHKRIHDLAQEVKQLAVQQSAQHEEAAQCNWV